MSLHSLMSLPIPEFFVMLQVGVSVNCKFNGNLNAECAVLPPSRSVAAIPDEATANAMLFCARMVAKINFGETFFLFHRVHREKTNRPTVVKLH